MIARIAAHAVLMVAAASLLCACGGGGNSGPVYTVSVSVAGLTGSMVLELNDGDDLTVTADGSSSFSSTLPQNASYSVTEQTQPAMQYCTVSNGSSGSGSGGSDDYFGLADEAGDFFLIDSNASASPPYEFEQVGSLNVNATAVTGSVLGVGLDSTYADGSSYGSGTLTGTVTPRSMLNLSTQFTTAMGSASSTTLQLSYDPVYQRASTLATIAGNFVDGAGNVMSISGSGVINGTMSILDSTYNAYGIQLTYASCTGAYAVWNALTFSGIGTLENERSPEEIIASATATTAAGGEYVNLYVLSRN